MIDMLRCGQSKKTFAATAKSGDARIHTLRTKGEFAAAAPMTASRKLALPQPRSVRFMRL
jgi:hypothetical protein